MDQELLETLQGMMSDEEIAACGIQSLTPEQISALLTWGIKQFELGEHCIYEVKEVSEDGGEIKLDDSSVWVVQESERDVTRDWQTSNLVALNRGRMYLLNPTQAVHVIDSEA